MKKKIKFKIGKVFHEDDVLSYWIFNLALIRNDLLYSNEYALKIDTNVIPIDGKFVYFFRITVSHYREDNY